MLTDNDTPWTDPVVSGDTWYRVVAVNGARSEPQQVGSRETVLTDPVESFGLTDGHAGVDIHPGNGNAVVRPTGTGPAWVSWHNVGTRRVRLTVLAHRRPDLTVQVSADGTTWRSVPSHVDRAFTVTAATRGADYVRVLWKGDAGLTGATFWADDPAPVTGPPPAFGVTAPAGGATGVIGPSAFTWAPAAGTGYYTLTASRKPDLSSPVIEATRLDTTTYTPVQGLDPAMTWYWSVRATNAAGSTSTPVATFTTRALPAAPAAIDDFEGYADGAALTAAYVRNTGGDLIVPTLVPSGAGHALQLEVTPGAAGYAGVTRTFATPVDLWGQQGIAVQLDRSGTRAGISLQFVANGVYWEYTLPAGTPPGVVRVPFTSFTQPSWAPTGPLDLRSFTQLSVYLGGSDSGRLVVDDVQAYPFTQ